MPVHPCAEGLTKLCFKTYPTWARQALAYKLLHILLPKQITKNLPRNLNQPLIPPGIIWNPGDPLPPGTIIPPDISPAPPDTGPIPPIYIPPFEPGPPKPPPPTPPPAPDIGQLLLDQGTTTAGQSFGHDSNYVQVGAVIQTSLHADVKGVYVKIGKHGAPTDNVNIEIWRYVPEWKPVELVTGGAATQLIGASLKTFSITQENTLILFPDKPHLAAGTTYCFVFSRTGDPDPDNYYILGTQELILRTWFRMNSLDTWSRFTDGLFECHIYGDPY